MFIFNEMNIIKVKYFWLNYLENKAFNIESFYIIDDFFKLIETSQDFGNFFNRPNEMTYLGISLDEGNQVDIIINAFYSTNSETESLKIMNIYLSPRISYHASEKIYSLIIEKIMEYSKKNQASSKFKIFFRQTTEINYFNLIYDSTSRAKLKFDSTLVNLNFFGKKWFSFELV